MRKFNASTPTSDSDSQDEPVCAGHALGFHLQSALGFTPIETITLDVFRCICDVYATASAQAWEAAVRLAEEHLGPADGPLLVARVTALLRALRQERGIGFSYLSSGCRHVSPDELTIAGLLKAARMGDRSAYQRGLTLALDNAEVTDLTRLAVRCLAETQLQYEPQSDQSAASEFAYQTVQAVYLH
jgi:hypothetical protein